jgi:hypothetical protein
MKIICAPAIVEASKRTQDDMGASDETWKWPSEMEIPKLLNTRSMSMADQVNSSKSRFTF